MRMTNTVQNRELRLEAIKKWMRKDHRLEALIAIRCRQHSDDQERQVKQLYFYRV